MISIGRITKPRYEYLTRAVDVDLLETEVAERRHHERRGVAGDRERQDQARQARLAPLGEEPDEAGHGGRGRRTRQALEVTLVAGGRMNVETRQPQRRAQRIEERDDPAEAAPLGAVLTDADHAPLVDQHGGRDAEGHHVGEAVVLLAEGTLGARPARHAAVEAIEQHGDEDRAARQREVAVDGCDDGIEAGEQAARWSAGWAANRRRGSAILRISSGSRGSVVTAGIIGESPT